MLTLTANAKKYLEEQLKEKGHKYVGLSLKPIFCHGNKGLLAVAGLVISFFFLIAAAIIMSTQSFLIVMGFSLGATSPILFGLVFCLFTNKLG